MATYKVWLTVKDRYGNTKEIDGGNINVEFDKLTQEDLDMIEDNLPLEDYLKKSELQTAPELDFLATDVEVKEQLDERNTIRYSDFFDKEEN